MFSLVLHLAQIWDNPIVILVNRHAKFWLSKQLAIFKMHWKLRKKNLSIIFATLAEEKDKGDKTQTGICDNRAGET